MVNILEFVDDVTSKWSIFHQNPSYFIKIPHISSKSLIFHKRPHFLKICLSQDLKVNSVNTRFIRNFCGQTEGGAQAEAAGVAQPANDEGGPRPRNKWKLLAKICTETSCLWNLQCKMFWCNKKLLKWNLLHDLSEFWGSSKKGMLGRNLKRVLEIASVKVTDF